MKRENDRREEREDLIIGRNSVMEAVKGDRTIECIYLAKGEKEGSINAIIKKARERKIVIKDVDKKKLDVMCDGMNHQGIIARVTPYKYFTVDDGQIDLAKGNYLLIGTLETYTKVVKYFGQDKVLPIYIEVEDGERLIRAIDREKQQKEPKYEEMCRRFLADASDFSEENLKKAGVSRRFQNRELVNTIQEIEEYVSEN